ncbi:hypothetical protein LJR235_001173 [Pararhizobium sp. LjRoot235]|uniref:hypothetical protein n=1 Tax=Pararhizobium sp. LjRoot235 TaxID=3342291 RepID=UPI003ED03A7D
MLDPNNALLCRASSEESIGQTVVSFSISNDQLGEIAMELIISMPILLAFATLLLTRTPGSDMVFSASRADQGKTII